MDSIVIKREGKDTFTPLSTIFIDEYMPYANDAQLKVYIYLLRSLQESRKTGICDMADHFNYPVKDIIRALDYWERKGLLNLSRDPSGTITYICVLNPESEHPLLSVMPDSDPVIRQESSQMLQMPLVIQPPQVVLPSSLNQPPEALSQEPGSISSIPEKHTYTPLEIQQLSKGDDMEVITFFAQKYLGRPLSPSDIQSLLFIYDQLSFSPELIDHLIQYCVEKGKRQMRYIEKVAINWYQDNITTVEQAKEHSGLYERIVYDVLKLLGRFSTPTTTEADIILNWQRELGFDRELIIEACNKAAVSAEGNRLRYTDGILRSWKKANVRTKEDIQRLDAQHQQSRATVVKPLPTRKASTFSHFPQQDYDIDDLEKRLLSNQG